MRIIKKYSEFNEALLPSQFREFVNEFDRERYADYFKQHQGEHDRNYYRIYLPIEKKKSETHQRIENLLDQKGYEIVDYTQGKCKFKGARNTTRINQVLTRLSNTDDEAKELSKRFVEDPDRKAGDDLMVCISRHPYDIAGSDTDRSWTNCLTLPRTNTKRYLSHIDLIKKELSKTNMEELATQLEEMIEDDDEGLLSDIEVEDSLLFEDDEEREAIFSILRKNDIDIDLDLLVRYEDEDGFVETDNEEFNAVATRYNYIVSLIEDINTFVTSGGNTPYILGHVKSGVLMSYLIKKTDKNINDPIANLDIKPYFNIFNPDEKLLMADNKMYGHGTEEYKKTVDDWVDKFNGTKIGIFRLCDGIYNDNLMNRTILLGEADSVKSTKDKSKYSYKLDSKSKELYKNIIKDMSLTGAKTYINKVKSWIGDMKDVGSLKEDLISVTPVKFRKYYQNW